ncbi:transglutaminase domain-containing protein [Streptomyces sp. NPDC050548]|uniref:transglutaminase domain-containing protein n=1 Tax=Streptomyces sp. NPDC050548 TaxID=3365629 RepID=UPI00379D9883
MTSSLLTPRRRSRVGATGGAAATGSTAPTRILDWRDPLVAPLLDGLDATGDTGPVRRIETLRLAHRRITEAVRPVYSVQDERPVSEVLRRGRGSCSQRLAVLEAVARATGTATRVRGLLVDGTFWYPRFPRLRRIVPDRVLLAWPEFRLDEAPSTSWLAVSELFGSLGELSDGGAAGFTNSGSETLFEALSRTAVDWDGATTLCPTGGAGCDLSAYVVADLGRFDSRDELFARHGQTLCPVARVLAEPVMGRHRAA